MDVTLLPMVKVFKDQREPKAPETVLPKYNISIEQKMKAPEETDNTFSPSEMVSSVRPLQ